MLWVEAVLWNDYRYATISARVRIVNTGSSGRIYPSPYSRVFGIAPMVPKG